MTARYALLPWLTQRLASKRGSSESDASTPSGPPSAPQVQAPVATNLDPSAPPFISHWQGFSQLAPSSEDAILAAMFAAPPGMIDPEPEIAGDTQPSTSLQSLVAGWTDMLAAAEGPMQPGRARASQASLSPPKDDDPIWGEVIRKHFETKSEWIMERMRQREIRATANTCRESPRTAGRAAKEQHTASHLRIELEKQLKEHGFLN
jgi:hypothetical protein